jgi:hypothetical protein
MNRIFQVLGLILFLFTQQSFADELSKAVRSNNVKKVREILAKGKISGTLGLSSKIDLRKAYQTKSGYQLEYTTLLGIAIQKQNDEMIKVILDYMKDHSVPVWHRPFFYEIDQRNHPFILALQNFQSSSSSNKTESYKQLLIDSFDESLLARNFRTGLNERHLVFMVKQDFPQKMIEQILNDYLTKNKTYYDLELE